MGEDLQKICKLIFEQRNSYLGSKSLPIPYLLMGCPLAPLMDEDKQQLELGRTADLKSSPRGVISATAASCWVRDSINTTSLDRRYIIIIVRLLCFLGKRSGGRRTDDTFQI
jgi:hypothetical protein